MQELKDIAQIISELGFPIFVAGWLLIRTDKRLIEIRDAIRGTPPQKHPQKAQL